VIVWSNVHSYEATTVSVNKANMIYRTMGEKSRLLDTKLNEHEHCKVKLLMVNIYGEND